MSFDFNTGPYDPCPCGSGAKYKFCCLKKAKGKAHGRYPIGTIAYYGPDDKTITKIVAGIVMSDEDKLPSVERWMKTDILADEKIREEVKRYLTSHGVKSVVVTDGVFGCPHEEGIDFPIGEDCPFCPFWAGKQGTARRDDAEMDDEEAFEEEDEEDDGDDDDDDDGSFLDEELTDEERAEMEAADALQAENAEKSFERVNAIFGDREFDDQGDAVSALFEHLKAKLELPCEVTGGDCFRWEEGYALGGFHPEDYEELKKTQPSFEDKYQLLSINNDDTSQWMTFYGEDIAAVVKRVSDGKKFVLGLTDVEATDKTSKNYQLLDDYVVWFVNSR